ncbi:MAG: hypothetical protein KME60_05945 [Cyanomargarita calcarea GSE-NOS-MK-12-04C]|uniref:Uncharacterized protein n=1 Tax=Cyanomargarita calcarea GSE-NOS-MK-12-04C TaxID=2839659 RepID=A0A951QII9_9CYAN|nr:hypothetical protein [Cyanomargarita calcarea GSE-NOS-MK-12-04C]
MSRLDSESHGQNLQIYLLVQRFPDSLITDISAKRLVEHKNNLGAKNHPASQLMVLIDALGTSWIQSQRYLCDRDY